MDRREFFKHTSSFLAAGALAIGGREIAARELVPLSPTDPRVFAVGSYQAGLSNIVTLMDGESLQYVDVEVVPETKFANHPDRQSARIDGLIEGELLFAVGELHDGRFIARVVGNPFEPFRATVIAIDGNVFQTDIGYLIIDDAARLVESENLQAVPVSAIKVGDLIEGNSIYDIVEDKRYVSMIGVRI